MEKRNFNILVVAICIGITSFWLTAYNVASMGIDYLEYVKQNSSTIIQGEEDDEEIVITFIGKVKEELELTLEDLKSEKYRQITDDFDFINTYGTEWTTEYTGTTLWSILEEEGILESDVETFVFIGRDHYQSPVSLSIEDIAKKHEDQVILAYEIDGDPLYEDGPLRSVIDREALENENIEDPNSHFAVKNLKYIEIQ